jgi:hypothetical protein
MKKANLKATLKPLIKECIQEILFEEGILSSVISEVIVGVNGANSVLTEVKTPQPEVKKKSIFNESTYKQSRQRVSSKVTENRKKMLDAIGKSSLNQLNGVNIFEDVDPIPRAGTLSESSSPAASSPLSGVSPEDPGVDISALMGAAQKWNKLV